MASGRGAGNGWGKNSVLFKGQTTDNIYITEIGLLFCLREERSQGWRGRTGKDWEMNVIDVYGVKSPKNQ